MTVLGGKPARLHAVGWLGVSGYRVMIDEPARQAEATPAVVHVRDNVPGAIYIGRRARLFSRGWVDGSPFANPFKISSSRTREHVIAEYREWLMARPALVAQAKHELRGKVLECWCAPLACHGDVLLEVANAD